MVRVAVIWVLLRTETFDTVTPDPLTATVEAGIKLLPVSVKFTVVPCAPAARERDDNTGKESPLTLNANEPGAPETEMLYVPGAALTPMLKMAVSKLGLTTTTVDAVTPDPLTLSVAPGANPEPLNVTITMEPCTPPDGRIEVAGSEGSENGAANGSPVELPAYICSTDFQMDSITVWP